MKKTSVGSKKLSDRVTKKHKLNKSQISANIKSSTETTPQIKHKRTFQTTTSTSKIHPKQSPLQLKTDKTSISSNNNINIDFNNLFNNNCMSNSLLFFFFHIKQSQNM